MKKNDLVTIVVPFYNGEKYLKDCVDSIVNQDYENLEIILVDDGSSDTSPRIADDYAKIDERIKVIHQKNGGVSSARNNGIKNTSGKYICFTDVDDFLSREYVSYYYNLIKENNADIALTPQPRKFTEKNKYDTINYNNYEDKISVITGHSAALRMLYYDFVIASWNKMISMDLIQKNHILFDTNLKFGEGFNFSIDCFEAAKNVVIGNKKYYNYRVDNMNSVMTKFSINMITGSIDAQDRIARKYSNFDNKTKNACQYARWHTYCDLYNTFIGCGVKEKYLNEYKSIKKYCKKKALIALKVPIRLKDKLKSFIYKISPYIAGNIINKFRIRKFNRENM